MKKFFSDQWLKIKKIFERFRNLEIQFRRGRWEKLNFTQLILVYPIRLIVQVIKESIKDQCLPKASALAFTTILSLIPLITVCFSLLSAFGTFEDANSSLLVFIQNYLIPVSGDTIVSYLQLFQRKVEAGALGTIGTIFLFATAVSLCLSVEEAFNLIWKVRQHRKLYLRLLTFYALLTLGPVLLSVSLVQSVNLELVLRSFGVFPGFLERMFPFALSWIFFCAVYKLLPSAPVRWVPALISGFVIALFFELAKYGFNTYVSWFLMESYSKVYGAIAMFPIFLIWIYIVWLIILVGAELCYTIQNLKRIIIENYESDFVTNEIPVVDNLTPLEVFSVIAGAFADGFGPASKRVIEEKSMLAIEVIETVLHRLLEEKLIVEAKSGDQSGYLPSRKLDTIPLSSLINLFENPSWQNQCSSGLKKIVKTWLQYEEKIASGVTAAVLVAPDEPVSK